MRRQLVVCGLTGVGSALLWLVGAWGVASLIPCETEGFGCLSTALTTAALAVPVTILVSWLVLRLLRARGPAAVALLGPVVTVAVVVGVDQSPVSRVPFLSDALGPLPILVAGAAYAAVGGLIAALVGRRSEEPGTPPPPPAPGP
ncbi:hypothetical protein R8Z50_07910 [Longispora sp. K20-0274]|uniref:hypothetical protein n=1 Tax=Longispora sp. K20-0274 TaxID=3088255 RepID=UPI003999D00F